METTLDAFGSMLQRAHYKFIMRWNEQSCDSLWVAEIAYWLPVAWIWSLNVLFVLCGYFLFIKPGFKNQGILVGWLVGWGFCFYNFLGFQILLKFWKLRHHILSWWGLAHTQRQLLPRHEPGTSQFPIAPSRPISHIYVPACPPSALTTLDDWPGNWNSL